MSRLAHLMSIRLIGDMVPVLPENDRNDFDGALVRRVCNVRIAGEDGNDPIEYGIAVRRRVIPKEFVTVDKSHFEAVLIDSSPWYQVEAFSYIRGEYPGKPGSVGDVPFVTFMATWDRSSAYEEFASTHAVLSGLCGGYGLYDLVVPVMIGYRMHETGEGLPFDLWRVVKSQSRDLRKLIQEGW